MNSEIRKTLEAVQRGELSVDEALLTIKKEPFADIGYAKVDLHRGIRQGAPEVIYGAGKTAEQMLGIIEAMKKNGQETILITRLAPEAAECIGKTCQLDYRKEAGIGIIGVMPPPDGIGRIVVATGGTSDIPVAEEAALTAEAHGNEVVRLYDVGVAGLHRMLAHMDEIMSASVIIAIAGMEGALASVIGGLADCPVIAVPTSVGYGASFHGVSALLSMLNSCASGVSVVNIDNGFGAGYLAGMINHMVKSRSAGTERTDGNV
ncbi:MAG: nickel pincer cofactor biosynthesis protein LarB [Lachnospiraceae bacterium]|nr:nickel pincer cofactor biosynthesis protein LarB [Lachnospiraceae bacterium]